MPKVIIDGREIDVAAGTNLIEAAKQAGSSIPHYCYHKKLSIAGNCRICLVDIEKTPKLSIACNTKVADGMVVHTNNDKVKEGRQSVLEFILVNHPIDCPVCDQAGECKLQKYYMEHDLKESRMVEEKVHKDKAVALGPNVMLDTERCIMCSRCIRFCKEIAHQDQLCFTHRGDHTELTTAPGQKLDNPYSVNTVDICPVGALTSRDFRFKQRVWFLKETDSICTGCSTGCNIKVSHNKGVIYRLLPRQNEEVNSVWMCDEGRFTYKNVNVENRLRHPQMKVAGTLKLVRREEALQELWKNLQDVPSSTIVGVGSAQLTNEANSSFQKFLKEVLGVTDFLYHAHEVQNPSHDDILMSADKNPNRAGVEALAMKPLSQDKRYQVLFVLAGPQGGLTLSQVEKMSFEKNRKVIVFASHEDATTEFADFVFPISMWAEEEGHFTNRQHKIQKINPAFDPPGEAQPVSKWVLEFAKTFRR